MKNKNYYQYSNYQLWVTPIIGLSGVRFEGCVHSPRRIHFIFRDKGGDCYLMSAPATNSYQLIDESYLAAFREYCPNSVYCYQNGRTDEISVQLSHSFLLEETQYKGPSYFVSTGDECVETFPAMPTFQFLKKKSYRDVCKKVFAEDLGVKSV